jgi:5'-nucleotidase
MKWLLYKEMRGELMRILLTNDDGIYAPGIYALWQELKKISRVTVVAPDSERSSVGHGITLSHPIWFKKVDRKDQFFGYGISGTPADCVKFGIKIICQVKPDIIVSGINLGRNDGCSVFYSGTVAGAREGALSGIPAIAISLATFANPDFLPAARIGAQLVKGLPQMALSKGSFFNVNVPACQQKQLKGIRFTRQGTVPIHGDFRKRSDPNLRDYYWMTGHLPKTKKDLGVDTYALDHGYVTVTPIHCDMTDERTLDNLKDWPMEI